MKVFKPMAFYSCHDKHCSSEQSWPADELFWTYKGWSCWECREFLDIVGRDENGDYIFKPSESPEWDGKTLEEYLKNE